MKRLVYVCAATLIALGSIGRAAAGGSSASPQPVVITSIKNDVSPRLRDLSRPVPPGKPAVREIPLYRRPPQLGIKALPGRGKAIDPVVQNWHGSANMPAPLQSFEGLSNADNVEVIGSHVAPPDTNGDVGPNHYVQWVNLTLAVYDKSGALLLGPVAGNSLWNGFGGPCETTNDGDPIVLYDHLADRWFLSQFALPHFPDGPFFQCVAVSTTGDPTGSYYRYEFEISVDKLNDYPKFGVWPDAYYMSINQFTAGKFDFAGVGVAALERAKMLNGSPAQMIYFDLEGVDRNFFGLLPSDLDGSPPPDGTPNYFVAFAETPTDRLNLWEFSADFANPSSSTFGLSGLPNAILETAPFNSNFGLLCLFFSRCIPQPATRNKLDVIPDRLMWRLQYRNFGTYQTLVANHTVRVGRFRDKRAGIRWYELRDSGEGWSIHQQGTYAPDSDHRWMGSMAMDSGGNIALGFSVSSKTTYPSIRYVGRLANDPLGTLPQGETGLVVGGGSQTRVRRWGDYSMMTVDPGDGCTFWYTQEYYTNTSGRDWHTRIGALQFPSCQ